MRTTKFWGLEPWPRFWAQVNVAGDCWIWEGASRGNYGVSRIHGNTKGAHVHSFLWHYGPYDTRLQIAHRCGVSLCVNPAHLYAATPSQNEWDKRAHGTSRYFNTHCVNGHERTEQNTYTRPDGRGRQCRVCNVELQQQRRAMR
jgi:hypothetical protein